MAHTPGFARLARLARPRLAERLGPAPEATLGPAAISRRRFVLASAAAMLPACSEGQTPPVDVEIAVIGAGLAGTHCAYRLFAAGLDVRLYEASDRLGGRIRTSRAGHPDDQRAELGGELIDTNHGTLSALSEELGIELVDRLAGAPSGETWVVDGEVVAEATIVAQFSAVAPDIAAAIEAAEADPEAFAALDAMSLAAWLDAVVPARAYPELHAILTAAYRGEFGRETGEQSALNLIFLIGADEPEPFRVYGDSDERYRAAPGNASFVTRLAARIDPERIEFGRALTRLRALTDSYELDFAGPAGERRVRARHVVLAIPWTILRTLELDEAGLSPGKRALIDTLGYGANTKVIGWFTAPIWRTRYAASGQLTSDAAIQQTWDSGIGQAGEVGQLSNFLAGRRAERLRADAVERWWADAVLPELDALWPGVADEFLAGSLVTLAWPQHRWARASYSCYLPGQWASWGTEGAREGNLHFCGEHCSPDFQGWMEGAAETGALVAAALIIEYGRAISPALGRILASKLVVEQPGFDGALSIGGRWRARQVALARAARALGASR